LTAASHAIRFGVDLGGTKTEVIAIDGDGAERFRHRAPTPKNDYGAIVKTIAALVDAAAAATNAGPSAPVGVGIPGSISPASGLVKNANTTVLIGRPLDRDLAAALKRDVRLANDADCFALSEASDGVGADAAIVFGVILGTGVGGSLVVNRAIVRGPNAITGEWGHNPLPWPRDDERSGEDCYCGKQGCIETFLSGPAIARDYSRATGADMMATDIAARAEAGDPAARAVMANYLDRLARGLASVINIVDPHMIVLGGGISNVATLYRDLPQLLPRYVFSDTVRTRIAPPRHGDSSGVRGAAWLWP